MCTRIIYTEESLKIFVFGKISSNCDSYILLVHYPDFVRVTYSEQSITESQPHSLHKYCI